MGELHFVCLFKGDAMAVPATIAVNRSLMNVAIPMTYLEYADVELGVVRMINIEQRGLL